MAGNAFRKVVQKVKSECTRVSAMKIESPTMRTGALKMVMSEPASRDPAAA